MPKKGQFEVQLYQNGRWTTDESKPDQEKAVASAQRLLSLPRVEGARVVHSWQAGKTIKEEVVFTKMVQSGGSDVSHVQPIDWAPACTTTDDLVAPQARLVMNRLFRAYLDKLYLTPTEIMHHPRQLRRSLDQDQLMSRAVDKAAHVQAKADPDGPGTKKRREHLFDLAQHLLARVRAVSSETLPSLGDEGVDGVAQRCQKQKQESPTFLLRMSLAAELMVTRDWTEKLDRLVSWAQRCERQDSLDAIDDFVADTLGSSELIQELLGHRPNLAAALMALADLASGRFEADPGRRNPNEEALDPLRRDLAELLGNATLPQARDALLARLEHELCGDNPLVRDDDERAQKAFASLVKRLCPSTGTVGGSGVAAGLIERAAQLANKGAAGGRRHGLEAVLKQIKAPLGRLHFLAALAHSTYGHEQQSAIIKNVDRQIGELTTLAEAAPDIDSPYRRVIQTTAVLNALDAVDLPEDNRKRWHKRLDHLLAVAIDKEGIIEWLDDPNASLRERAFNLLALCDNQVLPEGEAMAMARKRVVGHLKRPNFERELVADTRDKTQAANELHRFYTLLKKAGLS